MAKIQQVGAITVWMIVFVALWLASTVFLVILYTGQEELKTENKRVTEDNHRLISDDEREKIKLVTEARAEGPTVVGLMEIAREATAELATGQGEDDAATVKTKRDQILSRIGSEPAIAKKVDVKDASLLGALASLYEALRSEHTLRTAEQERADKAEAQVKELITQNDTQRKDFDSRAKDMSGQVEDSEAGRKQYREDRDGYVAKLEKEFEASLADNTATLTRERQRLASLEKENGELRKKLLTMQERFGEALVGSRELPTARQADGSILMAVPGDEVIYVNLGEKDRLLLGMQFTVYPAATGIPADGKGKAQIEVVSIGPASAECRVVHLDSNQVLVEGDLVANPVYDRIRPLTFVTIGDFDLDHDQQADPEGLATIEAMIAQWGGVVTKELSATTDFVVLGLAPRKPRSTGEGAGEQVDRQAAVQTRWETYSQALTSAQNLAIPILPQEVFLNFLGYRGGH